MKSLAVKVVLWGLFAAVSFGQQTPHLVWSCAPKSNDINDTTDCYPVNASIMGGIRFEDYKVSNPSAVEFDPAIRMQELTMFGPSTAAAVCAAPPTFVPPAPTITFDPGSVVAQIYWKDPTANFTPSQFLDVQFTNFKASNGFASGTFGFRMIRGAGGTDLPGYNIQIQAGNAGLENIPGLPPNLGVGFAIDPVNQTASAFGTVPASELLRGAILGVFLNAQSILRSAKFTVTNPPPPGKSLWSGAELIALAAQAQPWIAAGTGTTIPLGPPYKCIHTTFDGYEVCDGSGQMTLFENMTLTWGGEYLGLRTKQSFDVLTQNLLTWANAKAPVIDPEWAAQGRSIWLPPLTKPILMFWPTLSADPALSSSDRQTIETWLQSLISPRPANGWFSDDLGYFAESVNMADAVRRTDDAGFALGVARFYGALDQMRPDGSFPLAARLSACSASYSNVDLLHLVSIAEMAATQGYDLYSMKLDGKSLDTAINFMLDAYANPALLAQYSKAGGGACFEGQRGDPPDFSFYSRPTSDLAWMEPYIARFPFSATSARLRKILGSNISAQPFPLSNIYTGLNATCAFRKSQEFQPVDGAKVAIVSGDNQTVAINQSAPAPLTVRVTDTSGKALAGILVSFAVVQGSANLIAPAQVLTDATGLASANLKIGADIEPVTVTATALGVRASFSVTVPGLAIHVKNSASFVPGSLAPDLIAFGEAPNIAPSLIVASANPWPISLGGVHLDITDSQGQTRPAPIYYVTTNAISYLVPAGTASGPATANLTTSTGVLVTGTFNVDRVSPGLFTANATGSGVPAGFWIRAAANGVQTQDYLFDPSKPLGSRVPVAVDLGATGDQVFLSLYGTGFRHASAATATVGGVPVPVSGFAAVGVYQGEDVVNVGPLPRSLAGRGEIHVVLSFDGKPANTVIVSVR